MKTKSSIFYLLLSLSVSISTPADLHAQLEEFNNISSEAEFTINGRPDRRIAIPFKLVNNLVILELRINNSLPLNFILDSGVGTLLITELPNQEEVALNNTRVLTLAGLGVGKPMQAFLSRNNEISFKNVTGSNIDVLFLLNSNFNLSSLMGMYVHGLIGYDIFANFAVEIDYRRKLIYLYHPEYFQEKFRELPKHRKWNEYPIYIENKKPYMHLKFKNHSDDSLHSIRLLIDSGSSNAFSFYDVTSPHIEIPQKTIPILVGVGLSGEIPGVLGEVDEVRFYDYVFENPVVAYPDSVAVSRALRISDRNGSLGGEVLKRFKVIFHYQKGSVFVRKNNQFGNEFSYNRSGIDITTPIPNLPLYIVSKIREGSVADMEGMKEGDILDRIDGKRVEELSLNEIFEYLEKDMNLSIVVDRDGKRESFYLNLKDELALDEKKKRNFFQSLFYRF